MCLYDKLVKSYIQIQLLSICTNLVQQCMHASCLGNPEVK